MARGHLSPRWPAAAGWTLFGQRQLARVRAAAGEDGGAAAGAELDRLLRRAALGEREGQPGGEAVAAARGPQLVAEHGDRPLALRVDVREGAPLRLRRDDRAQRHALLGQLAARATAELVVAEDGEERRLGAEPRELDGRHGASA